MFRSKAIALAVLSVAMFTCTLAATPAAQAQITFGVNIGSHDRAPVCPYGYFDYAPYDCSPYGYYGPDWFNNGVFIGSGPWFHGRNDFYGHVDNRYDPQQGYRGPIPQRGAQPFNHFQGNEGRDGRGHSGQAGHDSGRERDLPGYRNNYRNYDRNNRGNNGNYNDRDRR